MSSPRTSAKPHCSVRLFPRSLSLVALGSMFVAVDAIMYVIDAGYCLLKVFNLRIDMDTRQIYPISQANANQRMSRASLTKLGRVSPRVDLAGTHRLPASLLPSLSISYCSGNVFVFTLKESLGTKCRNPMCHSTDDLSQRRSVALLKSLGVHDLLHFQLMDSPP